MPEGQLLCRQNRRLSMFVAALSHPQFQEFIDEFLLEEDKAQESLMYITLARYLTNEYRVTGFELASMLMTKLKDKKYRQKIAAEHVKQIQT